MFSVVGGRVVKGGYSGVPHFSSSFDSPSAAARVEEFSEGDVLFFGGGGERALVVDDLYL